MLGRPLPFRASLVSTRRILGGIIGHCFGMGSDETGRIFVPLSKHREKDKRGERSQTNREVSRTTFQERLANNKPLIFFENGRLLHHNIHERGKKDLACYESPVTFVTRSFQLFCSVQISAFQVSLRSSPKKVLFPRLRARMRAVSPGELSYMRRMLSKFRARS